MNIKKNIIYILLFFLSCCLFAQNGQHPYVIRGEVFIDMEPIYSGHVDAEYPLDIPAAGRRALREASLFFSAMIYGWSFHYETGEKARGIEENITLSLVNSIQTGDPSLNVSDTEIEDARFRVWTDYQLNESQQKRLQTWVSGSARNVQGVGYSPSFLREYPGWLELKKIALEDSARAGLREMLRGSERNRPKEVSGFLALASFPRFYIESGRWAVSARFRVQVTEIVPFAVY